MVTVGQKFPDFKLEACVSLEHGKEFKHISLEEYLKTGKWLLIFFWPKDFTFVCPTEIKSFNDAYGEFRDRDTELLGASTDTAFVHLAWRTHHADLKELKFPMLADAGKKLSGELGILTTEDQVALRATYIIDPEGMVRWVNINDLNVGRNIEETLRVLDALQTDELCPCNWKKGEDVLHV
ncbi:alkyl hydroperoxide reductase/ Thiol specific antioxidant/ Mal allergen [Chloroherpeton thalassium ATCC 35110]|uniref:Alkyl hydroperoxide reductase C n=1 Tax=Chloroherpeton thalassium (strain ATCC 35110 / GB-78) TaxID=517418 RepID=B3QW58_CHLT3|nr:peroxiredoxin [Chloroherpeton thalassium]ACF14712.1 alkyl hydroperoxide reductase/ Thiol specific antioxidant/ Mal allergen [Chloroherpeton thalassium ATCC 35110]